MDESLKYELYFLIAKLLKSEFPSIGELFIHECEEHKMFPSLVFNDHPSFDQLEKTSLPDIPDDQLVKLIQLSCHNSQYPSLFFNASQKLTKPSLATCLSAHIFPNVSPMHGMAPQIRVVGHFKSVYCLAFDATSQLLITGSDDNIVKVWDYSTNTLMESFLEHSYEISDVQVHPSNEFFAVCSLDCTISVISLLDFSIIHSIEFQSKVHIIRFSPDGKYMAAALEEGNVKILSVPTYEDYYTIPSPNKKAVAWLSFSPGGEFLAFAADPSDLVIFSMSTFKTEQICHEHSQPPEFISFSRNSCKYIISCSYQENCIKLLEIDQSTARWTVGPKGDLILPHLNGHRAKVNRVSFNCDDSNIIAISKNSISCWDTQTKNLINTASNEIFTECCTSLAMHPYIPNIAFVGCKSGRASIWDTNLGEVIVPLQTDDTFEITEAIWANDGLSIVAADENGGYTKFAYKKQQFITIDQFFLSDFTKEEADHSTITDIQLQPLVPQPKITPISNFHLSIKLPEIRKEFLSEEEMIVNKWKMPSFELINAFIEKTSEDSDEEVNEKVRSESMSSLNIADKPITSSRMSTRHSISMFDESLDLDLDSDSDTRRFPNSSSSVIYNTRSRAKRRDQMKRLRNRRNQSSSRSSSDDEKVSNFRKKTRYESDDETSKIVGKGKRKGNSKEEKNKPSSDSYEYYYEEDEVEDGDEEEEEEEYDEEENEYEYEYEYEYESETESSTYSNANSESVSESDLEDKVVTLSGRKSTATHSFSPEPPKKRIKRVITKSGKNKNSIKDIKRKNQLHKITTPDRTEKQETKRNKSLNSTPVRKPSNLPKSAPSSVARSQPTMQKKPIIRRKLMDSPVTTISGRTTTIHRSFSPEPAVAKRKQTHKREHSTTTKKSSDKKSSKNSERKSSSNKTIEISAPKFERGQKIPQKVPDFITYDTQRIKTYVPQNNDSVVYIRDSHQMHLEECLCFQYPPPFQFMDDFPSIAYATVLDVNYFINGLLVTIRIDEPKNIKKIVPESIIYIPYPLAPDVLIERSKYENSISMARSLTVKQEIEVIKTDQNFLKGHLVTRDKAWLNNPYRSLAVQIDENSEKNSISPWEILFPMRRMNPTPAQRLCSQIRHFLKSLFENDDYEIFKDWKLCDLDKVFIDKKIRPVDLSLLLRRATNNYYRTTEELIDDVDRMKKTLLLISPKRKSEIQIIIDSISEAIKHAIERLHIQLANQK